MKKNQDVITDKLEPKKKQNQKIAEFLVDKLSSRGLELVKDCATFNLFVATKNKEKKKMVGSNACKNRFCPVCTWRKARKDALMISTMMQAIQAEEELEFLFLTLTTPNVGAGQLIDEINKFNDSFKKLMKRKQFQAINKGYVRKLEITYNKERDDYNPHFHVIIGVNKSYFTDKNYYLSQEQWLIHWRQVTGMIGVVNGHDEITQLHITKVRKGRGKNSQGTAINEVAKYSAKDTDMTQSKEVFDTLYSAMKGRQLITFNGIFKDYRKKFDQGELKQYMEQDKNDYFYMLQTKWNDLSKKFELFYHEMSDYEKAKYNGQKIIEIEVED